MYLPPIQQVSLWFEVDVKLWGELVPLLMNKILAYNQGKW